MTYKRANGMGTIYKIKNSRRRKPWVARVTIGWVLNAEGKAVQKKYVIGTFATQREAQIALSDYTKLPYDTSHVDMSFKNLFEYWEEHDGALLAKNTRNSYKNVYKHLAPLHDKAYRMITAAEIEDISQKLSTALQTNLKSLIYAMDKTAHKLDIPIKTVSSIMSKVTYEKTFDRKPFTEDEIETLWRTSSDNNHNLLVLTYIYTGWRFRELLGIRKDDVDLKEWTMTGGLKTAAGKNRVVPIHPRIRQYIQHLYSQSTTEMLIDLSETGVRTRFKQSLSKLGMSHVIHETRHTFRTRLFNAGVNNVIIDRLCGHVSKSTGEAVYTHVTLDQLREAIELLP